MIGYGSHNVPEGTWSDDTSMMLATIDSIVEKAIERNTGARGLRSIIEEIMRDVMFDIPSNPKIETCIITKATVEGKEVPKLIINENKTIEKPVVKKKRIPAKIKKQETAS